MARPVETPEYHAMMARMVAAYGRRVGNGDPEDLTTMLELRAHLEVAIAAAVEGQRSNGWSWATVARGLGVSRQAAYARYGRAPNGRRLSPGERFRRDDLPVIQCR